MTRDQITKGRQTDANISADGASLVTGYPLYALDRGGNPYEQDDGVTDLQEQVLELLERAGLPTEINDQIMALVATGERSAA